MQAAILRTLDFLVPFGPQLRKLEDERLFVGWQGVFLFALPHTFFIFWLFSFIPLVGVLLYILVLVPLSALLHTRLKKIAGREQYAIYLQYFVVIVIGFGGLWGFIGHTFLANTVALDIGWPVGSPFQMELAFYHLGLGIAGLLAVWLRGHMITALVISKSIFWYGAAFVHVRDALLHANYSPLNVGVPLVVDTVLPTVLLGLLIQVYMSDIKSKQ
ncbi:MAG: DUF6790 family protein [Patescibacteria group bacterium]